MRYHCGDEPNPFQNHTQDVHIDRRTLHGYGIPKEDIRLFQNKIYFDKIEQTWNCVECGYKKDKYGWRQVYGHVRACHCYESRKPNERWNIPINEQFGYDKKRKMLSTTQYYLIYKLGELTTGKMSNITAWRVLNTSLTIGGFLDI